MVSWFHIPGAAHPRLVALTRTWREAALCVAGWRNNTRDTPQSNPGVRAVWEKRGETPCLHPTLLGEQDLLSQPSAADPLLPGLRPHTSQRLSCLWGCCSCHTNIRKAARHLLLSLTIKRTPRWEQARQDGRSQGEGSENLGAGWPYGEPAGKEVGEHVLCESWRPALPHISCRLFRIMTYLSAAHSWQVLLFAMATDTGRCDIITPVAAGFQEAVDSAQARRPLRGSPPPPQHKMAPRPLPPLWRRLLLPRRRGRACAAALSRSFPPAAGARASSGRPLPSPACRPARQQLTVALKGRMPCLNPAEFSGMKLNSVLGGFAQ